MSVLKAAARKLFGYERRQQILRYVERWKHFGFSRYCPYCRAHLRMFQPFGHRTPRPNAMCPLCCLLERHRLMYLYITERTDLLDGRPKKMLHVAPEPRLSRWFQEQPYIDYLSADLCAPHAMVKMDITDIQFPDNTFDVIFCSHVLEHVLEDRQAMREFFRVLKPGGWAILQVPIEAESTFEDPSVVTPEDRERIFGQLDHVRIYGRDYADRLVEAGFAVTVDDFARKLSEKTVQRFGLVRSEDVYFCRKGPPAGLDRRG